MKSRADRAITVDGAAAQKLYRQATGLRNDVGTRASILESVRMATWVLSEGGTTLVNGRRLTNLAERSMCMLGLEEPERTDRSRTALWLLQRIGDVGSCGNDWWLPAPSRLVQLGVVWLLVGGRPTFALPGELRAAIRHRSPIRTLSWQEGGMGLSGLPVQDVDAWLRRPRYALTDRYEWMMHTELNPVSDGSGSWEAFVSRGWRTETAWYSHGQRWNDLQRTPDGRHVVRHTNLVDKRTRYYVANVRNGTVAELSPQALDPEEARLLFFAVDHVRQAPLKVHVLFRGERSAVLTQRCALPRAEVQLLFASAVKHKTTAQEYPVEWRFADTVMCREVLTHFERLGITIDRQHDCPEDSR